MNRVIYTLKAFTLLAIRVIKNKNMPYHSKEMNVGDAIKPENQKYLHNGIKRTAKAILNGTCRLHWLKD